jgi:hypothetical protein
MPTDQAPNFFTVGQAAEFFHDRTGVPLDERTVRRGIEAGQIPSVKIGNKVLVPVPPLLALLQVPEQPQAPAAPGVNPELVAHALDLVRAALRILEPHLDGADVRPLTPVKDDPNAAA